MSFLKNEKSTLLTNGVKSTDEVGHTPTKSAIYQRIKKHGENITLKAGRPKATKSHKKKTRRAYLENIKLKKIENGSYKPRGRPKKIN
jgi:anti-sigma28 factor (negative regulator of flagellin synthesis)